MQMTLALVALVEQRPAFAFGIAKMAKQQVDIGGFEIVPRIFLLGLFEDVAIGDARVAVLAVEVEVVDRIDALHIHREALQAVGEFSPDTGAHSRPATCWK